jgi:hypothetical protein
MHLFNTRNIRQTSENIHTKEHKHERHKTKIMRNREFYCQTNASVSVSEQLPEDGQMRPKHVAIDVILISF